MKLSYSTWGMQKTPIDIAVAHCAALGFDGLELTVIPGWPTDAAMLSSDERKRIRHLYDTHQIELCGFSGNVPLLADAPEVQADAIARFRSYLELAADMQRSGERLIVTTTTEGRTTDWEPRQHELIDILGDLSAYAGSLGVMVGIEPHVGAALRDPADVQSLVEQVASDHLTIHFDISHFNVQGMNMDEVVANLAPISLHTHVKDERGLAPDHQFLIPGEGDMDYVRYLQGMHRSGYSGHIVVEISIMVQARPGYDALAAATQSYQVLSRAFDDAGIARGHS